MSTAFVVVAAIAFSFALGSLIRQVDGATLRRWRLSRRWDVSRLAREFIKAADEPLATLRGLRHMINAWERGARRPSERYWLLYLRVFPECAIETATATPDETEALPYTAEIDATETTVLSSADGQDPRDFRSLAATVDDLKQQIAGLSTRLEKISRNGNGEEPSPKRRKARTKHWNWTPFWITLIPSLEP